MKNKLSIKNKKAFFNYEIIENEVAGVVLVGTEVKSVINGNISFTDAYCDFIENELWLKNFHIAEYDNASAETHDPKRDRKLLLTKQQLKKFRKKFDEKGLKSMKNATSFSTSRAQARSPRRLRLQPIRWHRASVYNRLRNLR